MILPFEKTVISLDIKSVLKIACRALGLLSLLVMLLWGSGTYAETRLFEQELEQLIRKGSNQLVIYEETRESPWLAQPVNSNGILFYGESYLEKREKLPGSDVWTLYPTYVQWSDKSEMKKLSYDDFPHLGTLANALINVVSGKFSRLSQNFHIELSGLASSWHLRLRPKKDTLEKAVMIIDFYGTDGRIDKFMIFEAGGQITTTRLSYAGRDNKE